MPQVNLSRTRSEYINGSIEHLRGAAGTYCSPNKLVVNSAIRIDSVRPFIKGDPTHLAACGMVRMAVLNLP